MMSFDNCCCCFSLRGGTIAIAIIGLIQTLISLLLSVALYVASEDNRDMPKISPVISGTAITIGFIIYGVLLFGSAKRKRHCLWPYMITTGIGSIVTAIATLVAIVMLAVPQPGIAILVLVIGSFAVAFSTYLLLVVRSFYVQLRNEEATMYAQFTNSNPYPDFGKNPI